MLAMRSAITTLANDERKDRASAPVERFEPQTRKVSTLRTMNDRIRALQSLTSTLVKEGPYQLKRCRSLSTKVTPEKAHAAKNRAKNVKRALQANVLICLAKLGAWVYSGSASMWAEFVHSVVDCGNQSVMLIGLHDAASAADRQHPYGYGKSVYFWSLVSALGTFFFGAGVSGAHAISELMHPSIQEDSFVSVLVLLFSLAVDGQVLYKTLNDEKKLVPKGGSLWKHLQSLRDPATLAVLLEDSAACIGVVVAMAGIGCVYLTGQPMWDPIAGCLISGLLATVGVVLGRMNYRFLLGQAVDSEISDGIKDILLNRPGIDNVHSIQTQWTGADTFSFKAEVDFDGTYLAATLFHRYESEFLQIQDDLKKELKSTLGFYAEDIMRTVEREVKDTEDEIRRHYPEAQYIELEPMSRDSDKYAIDADLIATLRSIEEEEIDMHMDRFRNMKNMLREPSELKAPDEDLDPKK